MQVTPLETFLNFGIAIALWLGLMASVTWLFNISTRLVGVLGLLLFADLIWLHNLVGQYIYLQQPSGLFLLAALLSSVFALLVIIAVAKEWGRRRLFFDEAFKRRFLKVFSVFVGVYILGGVVNSLFN